MSEVSEVSKDFEVRWRTTTGPEVAHDGGRCSWLSADWRRLRPGQLSSLPYEALLQLDDIQGNVLAASTRTTRP